MKTNIKKGISSKKVGLEASDRRIGIILIIPVIIFMLFLVAYPLVNLVILSTQNYNMLTGANKFTGMKNYLSVFEKSDFWHALSNTMIYAIFTLFPASALGTLYAVVLNQKIVFRSLIRAFVIFPYLVPMVVSCAVFKYMFNDLVGILDHTIIELGLSEKSINLFGNYKLAMAGVVMVSIWKYTPMMMIAVLGKLQTIPSHLYEAAKIDGSNAWNSFWHITFPYIQPVLIVVMLMRFIWLFNKWDVIYLLTGGGPLDATQTLPTLLYSEAFSSYNLGGAAAIGVIMFLLLVIFSKIYYRINEKAEGRL